MQLSSFTAHAHQPAELRGSSRRAQLSASLIQPAKPRPHVQVTGEAVYTDDIKHTPDTLHAALVTSTKPHARLLSVDASAALEVSIMQTLLSLTLVLSSAELHSATCLHMRL